MKVDNMSRCALWHQLLASFCKLLPKAVKVFIAQYGTKGYTKHQAVVDLVAMLPDEALASIKITTHKFLIFYKKTNTIAVIPMPTIQHNLQPELNEINGPPPLGATVQPSQPTAAANAIVAAPAAVTVTPTAQAVANASMITPFGFQFGRQVNAVAGTNLAASTPDSGVFPCNLYVGLTITTPASHHAAGGFVMALVMYNEQAKGYSNQYIANLQVGNIN